VTLKTHSKFTTFFNINQIDMITEQEIITHTGKKKTIQGQKRRLVQMMPIYRDFIRYRDMPKHKHVTFSHLCFLVAYKTGYTPQRIRDIMVNDFDCTPKNFRDVTKQST
jgi:hypothetical protein